MLPNRRLWIIAVFLISLSGTGSWIYYQQHRFKHFAVHEPGLVYRSAWLAPDALSQLIETYQIRSVVNLCEPKEMTPQMWDGERRSVAAAGAMLYEAPLPNSVTVDPMAWKTHLAIMDNPDNYPMLVHCQHGVTRTCMFLTAYDVLHRQKTADESLAVQPLFGHNRANVHIRTFAKNFETYVHEHPSQIAANPGGVVR
jgi:hypothetical protein